ncbi:hypothetical protein GOE06_32070, partial [Sinorhizobium medicae]|nr:hypothetical protein [Sinorhizobium medicae]
RRVLTPAHVAPIDPLSDPRRTHQDLCAFELTTGVIARPLAPVHIMAVASPF